MSGGYRAYRHFVALQNHFSKEHYDVFTNPLADKERTVKRHFTLEFVRGTKQVFAVLN